jgi:ornithine cyclodeaminase
MTTRILTARDVRRLLPMPACITAMDLALRALANGDAVLPLRPVIQLPDGTGALAAMPAYLGNPKTLGLKTITIFPGNHGGPLDSHQGVVIMIDPANGRPFAILDASSITAIRTAAVSAVATRALARPDAGDLAIIGTGVQAMMHLEAMICVRSIRRVRTYSRNPANVGRFAKEAARRMGIGVEPSRSARDAVDGADIICTVTASHTPVVEGAWIKAGAHINAVGASLRSARELDTEAVRRSAMYVDRRESALAEAGEILIPMNAGMLDANHIRGEIGELLESRIAGRSSDDEVTLFKSLGLAIEDLAAADVVLRNAAEQGIGQFIELGTAHDADG